MGFIAFLLCITCNFRWGVEIDAHYIATDPQARAAILDSPFNSVTFGNSLKWKYWSIPATHPNTEYALAWVEANGLRLRGHTMFWFKPGEFPADITEDDARQRIEEMATLGVADSWDLLNEPGAYLPALDSCLLFRLGSEATGQALFVNDFAINNPAERALLHLYIAYTLNCGLDGIGLQGRIMQPMTAAEIGAILDEFGGYGLPVEITEYDCMYCDDKAGAWQMQQMLAAIESREFVTGFTVWGLADHLHWHGNSPLYRDDWTLKPAGVVLFAHIKRNHQYFPIAQEQRQ